jgi:hypothetical protein
MNRQSRLSALRSPVATARTPAGDDTRIHPGYHDGVDDLVASIAALPPESRGIVEALVERLAKLAEHDRRLLLERLVTSLDAENARDEAWDRVAAARDAEIAGGSSATVSGPEAVARIRSGLV